MNTGNATGNETVVRINGKAFVSVDTVRNILKRRMGWCSQNYEVGEHMPDVYALALVAQDIKALITDEDESGC